MAKQLNDEKQFNLSKGWRQRRREQGYSYAEVKKEIMRRAKGEYVISPEERDRALAEGIRILALRYKLSALFTDFLDAESITEDELAEILDCDAHNTFNFMLDPYPSRGESTPTIENDPLIDRVYPGKYIELCHRE